jgi:hypothetical protein
MAEEVQGLDLSSSNFFLSLYKAEEEMLREMDFSITGADRAEDWIKFARVVGEVGGDGKGMGDIMGSEGVVEIERGVFGEE